ncbi:MAG: hypothetical protein AAB677_00995 [Patescibacteria group bacterium]
MLFTVETTEFETPNGKFSFNVDHAAQITPVAIEVIKDGQFLRLED